MIIVHRGHRDHWYKPIDDGSATFSSSSVQGLEPEKIGKCDFVEMRFSQGDGRVRVTGQAASSTEGYIVTAGDVVMVSRYEALNFQAVRVGSQDLIAWATYYSLAP